MKLSDAVRRAKDYKGTLLKGCTFYVTDNAVADHDLLKAVVKAAGGEVLYTSSRRAINVLTHSPR